MVTWTQKRVEGWGRFPTTEALCARPERWSEVQSALTDRNGDHILAHGLGRSYGDAALLTGGRIVLTRRLDRLLAFDPDSGWIRAEAGVSLEEVNNLFVPRGFFPPVVPGTQFVTLGGALAADIHGKNHHVHGSFGDHVRNVELLTADGRVVLTDREHEPELFEATLGGMGLTGVILAMDLQLMRIESPAIEIETVRVENLDHFFEVSAESAKWPYTVSWIDCLARGRHMGRGVFMRGRHAPAGAKPGGALLERLKKFADPILDVSAFETNWLLNRVSIQAFNETYFRLHRPGTESAVVPYTPFFFPLDMVRGWNKLYGSRGMMQYQPLVPHDPERRAMRAILESISKSGFASFLAVIKEFGEVQHGGLSFPRPGVTLALDFANHGKPLHDLMDHMDDIVLDAGGRLYLAKDARMTKDRFQRMYPEWQAWKAVRDRWDPNGVFSSDQAQRLGLVDTSVAARSAKAVAS